MPSTRVLPGSSRYSVLLALAALGCGPSSRPSGSGLQSGTVATNPQSGELFIVDANSSGQSASPRLVRMLWGRRVDLYALDPTSLQAGTSPVFRDLLVDPEATSDGATYLLERDPLDGRERLTVLHDQESPEFAAALTQLEAGLVELAAASGPFASLAVWPRNATLALVFDDLLADGGDASQPTYPGSVLPQNVHLEVGYPPTQALQSQVFPDPNHGDVAGGSFHTTRVLIAPSVSLAEAQSLGLPVNVAGLPAAVLVDQPNLRVRVPTQMASGTGQHSLLTNLSGHPMSLSGSGAQVANLATQDVGRLARSGSGRLGDAHNGFLRDDEPPRIVAELSVLAFGVNDLGQGQFELDLAFSSATCALSGSPGDLLETAAGTFQVVAPGQPPSAGVVSGLHVRRLQPGADPAPGIAQLRAAYDPDQGHQGACFVAFTPLAGAPPTGQVDPKASVLVHLSEPLDPDSVRPLETFVLRSGAAPTGEPLKERVLGSVLPRSDLAGFLFLPQQALSHTAGESESFRLEVSGGPGGWTDLAGNALQHALPEILFQLDPAAPTLHTGSLSLTFSGLDEDGNGSPELRGQLSGDAQAGTVRGRAVSRFSADVDGSFKSPLSVQAWTPLFGFPEPLSPLGARVMATWRYHDLGLDLMSDSGHNLDVEGLAWMPEGGKVSLDTLPEFEMSLAHSFFLPDEYIDPATGGVPYPTSGLVATFDQNLLEPASVVHARERGFHVQPLDAIQSSSGTLLAPWPLNRDVPLEQYSYWTWRDTAQQAVGGPNGAGVDTAILQSLDPSAVGGVYPSGQVPSIGLPLLMQFKAWPNGQALGFNRVMMGMANPVGIPYFRAWSGGYFSPGGTHVVDPDDPVAMGGIDPAGNAIPGTDIGVMYGRADFVTRVSRAHTIWLDTGNAHAFGAAWIGTGSNGLPQGTEIRLDFRGAVAVSDPVLAADATQLDPYGDPLGGVFTVSYLASDPTWTAQLSDLDGARYIQVRLTLLANAATGLVPELTALGLGYHE